MAETIKLFDLPYEVRRENYVKQYLGEDDKFGHPDIEAWLAKQKKSKKPEMIDPRGSIWLRIMDLSTYDFRKDENNLFLLHLAATPTKLGGLIDIPGKASQAMMQLFRSIGTRKGSRLSFYNAHECQILVVEEVGHLGGSVSCVSLRAEPEMCEARLTLGLPNSWLMDAVFDEWLKEGLRWKQARKLFCDLAVSVIRDYRQQAEREFHKAIACSADGREIIHARRVFIYLPTAAGGVFVKASRYYGDNKILISRSFQQRFYRSSGVFATANGCCHGPVPEADE